MIGVDGATYKAMEFTGETIKELSMDSRFTMANMAIEAGGKSGIFEVDEKTLEYIKPKAKREFKIYKSDEDAKYSKIIEIDVSKISPQVALPHLPENSVSVDEVKDVKIDQVVIGSCTNGRMEDLRTAAKILKNRKVHKEVRTLIFPGTQQIYYQALKEGLIEIFIEAGAVVNPPTCGPCLGGHLGVLAPGEVAISTTNRNFVGRMGHPESKVYLSSPAVAAASAVAGKIVHPDVIFKN
jgi:3-isopropylmalate/(R)-2-methylmalate dehydratase large subunit